MRYRTNENAAPDVAVIGNGEGSGRGANIPHSNYITPPTLRQAGIIEKTLLPGAENAIPAPELKKLLGAHSTRFIARLVEDERSAGAVILSTPDHRCPGYFLPDAGEKGQRETAEFVRSMVGRAAKILRSARPARAALENVEGQQQMDGWKGG